MVAFDYLEGVTGLCAGGEDGVDFAFCVISLFNCVVCSAGALKEVLILLFFKKFHDICEK